MTNRIRLWYCNISSGKTLDCKWSVGAPEQSWQRLSLLLWRAEPAPLFSHALSLMVVIPSKMPGNCPSGDLCVIRTLFELDLHSSALEAAWRNLGTILGFLCFGCVVLQERRSSWSGISLSIWQLSCRLHSEAKKTSWLSHHEEKIKLKSLRKGTRKTVTKPDLLATTALQKSRKPTDFRMKVQFPLCIIYANPDPKQQQNLL